MATSSSNSGCLAFDVLPPVHSTTLSSAQLRAVCTAVPLQQLPKRAIGCVPPPTTTVCIHMSVPSYHRYPSFYSVEAITDVHCTHPS